MKRWRLHGAPLLAIPLMHLPMSTPAAPRFLLCACPAHCAQVLRAAAAARVPLHGLQPTCDWPPPGAMPASASVLWALLPTPQPRQQARELAWRHALLLQPAPALAVQMLYGSAAQQAQQLAPWVRQLAQPGRTHADSADDADCRECLDAASEHALFTHLRGG